MCAFAILYCLMAVSACAASSATTQAATTGPYLVMSKPVYSPFEEIVIHFGNAAGNATNWIVIFLPATPSTNIDEFQWMYTDSTQSGTAGITDGTLTFNGLPADSYQARIHFNDGYTIEDSVDFTVE